MTDKLKEMVGDAFNEVTDHAMGAMDKLQEFYTKRMKQLKDKNEKQEALIKEMVELINELLLSGSISHSGACEQRNFGKKCNCKLVDFLNLKAKAEN
jgi:hypothetical protein